MFDHSPAPKVGYTDKCKWPFSPDPELGRVYAPWGAFGARYVVPDLDTYTRISSAVSMIYIWMIAFQLCFFLDRHLPAWLSGHLFFDLLVVAGLCSFRILRHNARGLAVAEKRPKLVAAIAQTGRDTALWRLWIGNLLCLVFAIMMFYAKPPTAFITILAELIKVAAFAAAGLFSAMIFFHEARVTVRRSPQALRR